MTDEKRTIPLKEQFSPSSIDCPKAPPRSAGIQARTLHRACLIVGGMDKLALHLKVSTLDLRRWLGGLEVPPDPIFHGCVEIVLLYAERPAAAN